MVLFALSFQDQVEKYGAYVGIAAFFGLDSRRKPLLHAA